MFQTEEKGLSEQGLILHLIQQNDYETLKEIGIVKLNLNYLEHYTELELDQKISPLLCACFLGRLDIVRLLLQNAHIDVDLASETIGQTPLIIAAMTGNYEILKLLLDAGAEVNKPNSNSQTAFSCCFHRLDEDKNQFENRKICMKMAELLLHYGSDIDWIVEKAHGYTLLMQLCAVKMEMGPRERDINAMIVKFLLENGAKRDLTTLKGKTLTDLVNKHKNKEKIMDLILNQQQIFYFGKNQKSHRRMGSKGGNSRRAYQ